MTRMAYTDDPAMSRHQAQQAALTHLNLIAAWIASHGFDFNVDIEHGCIQIVIEATQLPYPDVFHIVETVSTWSEARRALGY